MYLCSIVRFRLKIAFCLHSTGEERREKGEKAAYLWIRREQLRGPDKTKFDRVHQLYFMKASF